MYNISVGFSRVYYTVNAMKRFVYLQPMTPLKRFDIFASDREMLRRGLDAFRFFFNLLYFVEKNLNASRPSEQPPVRKKMS